MRTVLVTIDSSVRSVDCEIPGDPPIRDLIPLLVDICGLGEVNDTQDMSAPAGVLALGLATGQPFVEHESLIACGVVDGMRLLLRDRASWDAEAPFTTEGAPPEDIQPSRATSGIGVRWNRGGLRE